MLHVLLILAFICALFISIFAVQNTRPVNVLLLTFELREVPTAVLIVGSAGVGALIAVLVSLAYQIRRSVAVWRERREVRRQLQRVTQLEQEREELLYQIEVLRSERSVAGSPDAGKLPGTPPLLTEDREDPTGRS